MSFLAGMLLIAITGGVVLERCSMTPGASRELGPGQDVTVGQVQGEDLQLMTEGAGEPARLLGTLINPSDASVEVTVRDADDTATMAVSAGESFNFVDNPVTFTTIDAAIGEKATVTITAPGGEQEAAIPVYEGSIGGYVHYSPEVPDD